MAAREGEPSSTAEAPEDAYEHIFGEKKAQRLATFIDGVGGTLL